MVNVWASWCGPCRLEFPILQKLSARYGKRVAFLGVDSQDSDDAAATFLAEAPVPYPSYTDPDERDRRIARRHRGLPDTAFYDRGGEARATSNTASTRDDSELEADVGATRCAAVRKRIIEPWKPSSSSPSSAVGLLLAELLLPTGGILAALGVVGLVAAGVDRARLRQQRRRRRRRRP